jgi:hypothetical protein
MDSDMTELSAPTKPAPRRLDLGGGRRAGLAAVVVLDPLSITILRGILPYHAADESATTPSAQVMPAPSAITPRSRRRPPRSRSAAARGRAAR